MKTINLGTYKLPVQDFASQGNAVLGIRGSGKTYTATYLAEQLLQNGIPFVAFDPIGIWRFLKVPGKGKGYPVVVAGGKHGDLPLTPDSAPAIVRAAMKDNIPLILDLYSMDMSKADWRRIVESATRLLLYENKEWGLRHIFIEEAAEFAPQMISSDQGKVYAEIEKLARMGGNASLGYTLINQRAEQVNKAVLELCDFMCLHRQKGKNSIKAIKEWISLTQTDEGEKTKEIIQSLPNLKPGEAWVWGDGTLIKVPEKNSFHPDRKNPEAEAKPGTDVGKFVQQLKGSLAEHLEKVKENDPAELKKKLLAMAKMLAEQTKVVEKEKLVPVFDDKDRELMKWMVSNVNGELNRITSSLEGWAKTLQELTAKLDKHYSVAGSHLFQKREHKPVQSKWQRGSVTYVAEEIKSADRNGTIPTGARKILIALAQRSGLTKSQLAVRAGFAQSGTFSNYLSILRQNEFLTSNGQDYSITNPGLNYLGSDFTPLPTGTSLLNYWMRNLPTGAARILKILWDSAGVGKRELAEVGGFQLSGTFSNYLSKLNTLELIQKKNGLYYASEELYD